MISALAFAGIAAERIVPAALDRHQLRALHLGARGLRARMRLDLVVVAVDEQGRAGDLAIHLRR